MSFITRLRQPSEQHHTQEPPTQVTPDEAPQVTPEAPQVTPEAPQVTSEGDAAPGADGTGAEAGKDAATTEGDTDATTVSDAVVHRSRRLRAVATSVPTVLSVALVYVALILPNAYSRLTMPAGWFRLPIEGIVGVVLLLVLPFRARRVVAVLLGVILGVLSVIKFIDMGFLTSLGRTFDPVLDWVLFDDAYSFLIDSVGRAGAIGTVIAAVLLAAVVLVLVTLAVLRSTAVVVRHRRRAYPVLAVLTVTWLALATFGVHLHRSVSLAARSTSTYAYDRALAVRAGMQDQDRFAAEAAADAFRDTPKDKLLSALRGKDVIVAFVESYGRSAVEDPTMAEQIGAVLNTGDRRLASAGFAARSGWLTSPTFGGGSWLAHSTFFTGLWINNQQRYLANHRPRPNCQNCCRAAR